MSEVPVKPSIWVADLAAYNNGVLHGAWIDATQPAEDIWAHIARMLAASPLPGAEEIAIFDYDGFGPLRLSEYETIEMAARVAAGIAEHGHAFAVWVNVIDRADWDDQIDAFEDHFEGVYDSYEDFGEELLELFDFDLDRLNVPEALQPYVNIDTAALGRDWASGVSTDWSEGRLYVFFD